eukprot:SAG11_NODE_4_length_33019_cov_28.098909_2_plen_260_part_00
MALRLLTKGRRLCAEGGGCRACSARSRTKASRTHSATLPRAQPRPPPPEPPPPTAQAGPPSNSRGRARAAASRPCLAVRGCGGADGGRSSLRPQRVGQHGLALRRAGRLSGHRARPSGAGAEAGGGPDRHLVEGDLDAYDEHLLDRDHERAAEHAAEELEEEAAVDRAQPALLVHVELRPHPHERRRRGVAEASAQGVGGAGRTSMLKLPIAVMRLPSSGSISPFATWFLTVCFVTCSPAPADGAAGAAGRGGRREGAP